MANKVGRNEACPCGSGRKYKHCCLRKGVRDPFGKGTAAVPAPALLETHAPPKAPSRPTLRGACFTPAAAAAISGGVELPGLDLHPWIVAQLRERTGIGPGGRPPAWTISRVRAMDTAALEATLARLGVHVDKATFTEAAADRLSAWELSLDWEPVAGADSELLGLVACELWRRWAPAPPSLEMIDERMQDGYDALDRGDARSACNTWLEVWGLLLDTLPDAGSVEELDEGFATGLNRIGNWVGDVSIGSSSSCARNPSSRGGRERSTSSRRSAWATATSDRTSPSCTTPSATRKQGRPCWRPWSATIRTIRAATRCSRTTSGGRAMVAAPTFPARSRCWSGPSPGRCAARRAGVSKSASRI